MSDPSDLKPSMYSQLLRGIVRSLQTKVTPEIRSPSVLDQVEMIVRLLKLAIVEEDAGPLIGQEFTTALSRLQGDISSASSPLPPAAEFSFGGLVSLQELVASNIRDLKAGMKISADNAALLDLVSLEGEFLKRLAGYRDGVQTHTATDAEVSGNELDAEMVGNALRSLLSHSPDLRVTRLESIPGGRSKGTYHLELAGTDELPERCIMRIDRPVALLPTKAADEFELLNALREEEGIPVPHPYLVGNDPALLGGTFIIVGLLSGEKGGEIFPELGAPADHHHELGEHLAHIMARLHNIPFSNLSLPGSVQADDMINEVRNNIETAYAHGSGAMAGRFYEYEIGRLWLLQHLEDCVGESCLVHADICLNNMLVDNGKVTGLLDWELARIGPPAVDLSFTRHLIEFLMPWEEFVQVYADAGGPPSAYDPRLLTFYDVLGKFRMCSHAFACRQLYFSGANDDFVYLHAGVDMSIRCRTLLVKALSRAMTM